MLPFFLDSTSPSEAQVSGGGVQESTRFSGGFEVEPGVDIFD